MSGERYDKGGVIGPAAPLVNETGRPIPILPRTLNAAQQAAYDRAAEVLERIKARKGETTHG